MGKHIVLYNPQARKGQRTTDASLSLLSIAAMPYQEGYKIYYVNSSDVDAASKVIEYAKGALCVGFTVLTSYQIVDAIKVSQEIKKNYPDVKIVWGGWHPSILPEQTIAHEAIDIIVIGQGQRAFGEIVDALNNGGDLDKVKGIAYKKGGKIQRTEPRPFEDLNNFPPLPYDLVEQETNLMKDAGRNGTHTIFYFTSQGCPHRCRFCADPLVYKHHVSMLKPEKVIADIEYFLKRYNIDGVQCVDTNFFVDEKRVLEICKGLIKRKIKIKWECMNGRTTHLLRLSKETWESLKEVGLSYFLVGAESGNDETLKYIQKDTTVQDMINLTVKCKEYGFSLRYIFMLGLPPNPDSKDSYSVQIKKEWDALVNIINRILSISRSHTFHFVIYTPYPGAPLYEISKQNGFKEPKSLEEWGAFSLEQANTPWMPQKYVSLADQLNELYIPFLTGSVYTKLEKYGLLGKVAKIAMLPLHGMVLLRWRIRFYALPFEYIMMKLSKKAGHRLFLSS